LLYLKGIFFARFIVRTSQVIQRLLIKALLKSPLYWFDVTPTGRILARTSKDQDDLDSNLSFNVQMAVQNLCILFASVLLICIATPIYLIFAVFCGIVYFKLIKMYMNSSR
jgi:ABC-type multidrug transport system fused ATPase/permease subunit